MHGRNIQRKFDEFKAAQNRFIILFHIINDTVVNKKKVS